MVVFECVWAPDLVQPRMIKLCLPFTSRKYVYCIYVYMWQSCVEIEDYSTITFEPPYHWTSVKDAASSSSLEALPIPDLSS